MSREAEDLCAAANVLLGVSLQTQEQTEMLEEVITWPSRWQGTTTRSAN